MSNNEKRNGEIVAAAAAAAGQISNVLTTGTSTPALVAQALSGKTSIPDQEGFYCRLTAKDVHMWGIQRDLGGPSFELI